MKKRLTFHFVIPILLFLFSSNIFSQYYYNKAASFNGTSSYIAIPNDAELNPTTAITIEAWIYPKSLNGYPTIVGKSWHYSYWLGFTSSSGVLSFYPKGGTNVTGTSAVPLNKWTHVAATYDGSTTNFYINGVLDRSSTAVTGAINTDTDSLFIGADRDSHDPAALNYLFNGYIDNVRIWNVARTAAQIQNNMYTTLQMNIPTGNYAGLVAAYNLDGFVDDWSGTTRNNGTARNVIFIDLNGKPVNNIDYNNSLVLDGNSYCAVQNDNEFNATTAVTLEAWVKRDLTAPQPPAQNIIHKGYVGYFDYAMFLVGSTLYLELNNGTGVIITQSNAVSDDAWHHVAATYNSTDGNAVLYVDGNVANQTNTPAQPLITNTTTDSLFIGSSHPGGGADAANKFKGEIDEVRIWKNVVRTQTEIKNAMFVTKGHHNNPIGGFTYAFNDYTNWALLSNNALLGKPLNFRGNAYLSSSHLQNDYTSPILVTDDQNPLAGFTISTNRTTIPAGGTASDSVNITTAGNVNSVQAFVLLNHGAVGKLSMNLISPTGISVNLLPAQNTALTDHDIITIFDPAADSTISFTAGLKAPFSPRVKPFGNFSSFTGQANGIWKLRITDATTGTMLRVLNGWGLKLGIAVGVNDKELPTKFELNQNYPNPFNPTTTISYSLPKTAFVTLKIYDELGREVTTLVSESKLPGKYEVKFDGTKLSSGVYFYKITAENFAETKKFVLMK